MKLYIEGKRDKARARRVQAAIDSGEMPHPPRTGQEKYKCAICPAYTVLLTEVDGYGRVCNTCQRDISRDNSPARQPADI